MTTIKTEEVTTKQRILDTALELFAREGFAGTSMRALARAVGIRESSIYNHFASKDEIFGSLIGQWGPAAFIDRLQSAEYRALAANPDAFCRRCAADLAERWQDRRERLFISIVNNEQAITQDVRAGYFENLFNVEIRLLSEYFEGFADRDLARFRDSREAARIFAAGLVFLRMEHFSAAQAPSPPHVVSTALDRFVDTFLFMMRASPSS